MGGEARGLNVRVREALCDDLSSLCLVRECEELEEAMRTNYTENILRGEVVGSREMSGIMIHRGCWVSVMRSLL